MNIYDSVQSTIEKHSMLKPGDCVLAGVSGGADSVALLHLLLHFKSKYDLCVKAMHINHKLRGAESDRDESFVKALCAGLSVDLFCESAEVAKIASQEGLSLEEAGRNVRYKFLGEKAGELGCKIATAHNLDDSAETVLLNIARGTALSGVCGIPPVRGSIIRPLVFTSRAQIEEYLTQNGLTHITDSTNESDDYARNRIRHHVTPVLKSINENFLQTFGANLEAFCDDEEFLEEFAKNELKRLECGNNEFSKKEYLQLKKAIRYRILKLLLKRFSLGVNKKRLELLDSYIKHGKGGGQLSRDWFFKIGGDRFSFYRYEKPQEFFCIKLDNMDFENELEITVFSNKKIVLINIEYEYCEENIKNTQKHLKNALDCDRIVGIANIRQKMPGDVIKLAGRGCTKTLKKLFQEENISGESRGKTVILADDNGPLWVEGAGVAQRAAVTASTKRVLIIKPYLTEGSAC